MLNKFESKKKVKLNLLGIYRKVFFFETILITNNDRLRNEKCFTPSMVNVIFLGTICVVYTDCEDELFFFSSYFFVCKKFVFYCWTKVCVLIHLTLVFVFARGKLQSTR